MYKLVTKYNSIWVKKNYFVQGRSMYVRDC